VKVTDLTSGAADQSNGEFTIPNAPPLCLVTVTSPNGGEAWEEGSSHDITWNRTIVCGDRVKIELYNNGVVCTIIVDSTEDNGSFSWIASQCDGQSEHYRVRVTDLDSGSHDQSDADFQILRP
jgi:hypothetical protein